MSTAKTIILGVTGSIAAYKAADLTSLLTKQGHQVNVVLTADAQRFITPLPFKTLSRQPVVTDLYDEEEGWKPTHIRMADEADLLLIAPATANFLAKLAHGLANDALSCIALALNPKAKVLVAPATANCLAKLAHGLANDALSCIALALNPNAKVLLAPAMNGKMWQHPATQQNVATLKSRGAEFIGPEAGMLSCGYEGVGRLWPVEAIAQRAGQLLT